VTILLHFSSEKTFSDRYRKFSSLLFLEIVAIPDLIFDICRITAMALVIPSLLDSLANFAI
jgi:hypothetical protein